MSLKFEIADWRFEVTWDGMLCQPLERGREKEAKKRAAQPHRRERGGNANRDALDLAAQTLNRQTIQKGAPK